MIAGGHTVRDVEIKYGLSATGLVAPDKMITNQGARPGDVVVVAGKGHESYQIIGDRTIDFDDRQVLRAALDRRRERGSTGGGSG